MRDDSLIIRQPDLDSAVQAGILTRSTADELVAFVAQDNAINHADDEQLRLVTGFNDIFVTIGLVLFLGAIGYLSGGFKTFLLPVAAWLLAEIFTRKKHMALPSIVLLAVFAISSFISVLSVLSGSSNSLPSNFVGAAPGLTALSGLITAGLIGLHWLRFHVPITVAAGTGALVLMLTAGLTAAFPDSVEKSFGLILVPIGVAVFGLAMYFDASDRARRTRRSDMAFWLHLLAAPLIVHPLVWNIANVPSMSGSDAVIIFIMFAVLSFVALVIDRRALLVSSLAYLGYALSTLLVKTSWGSETFAVAVLGVGAVVLTLSVAWSPLRKMLLSVLPETIRYFVPAHQTQYATQQKVSQ